MGLVFLLVRRWSRNDWRRCCHGAHGLRCLRRPRQKLLSDHAEGGRETLRDIAENAPTWVLLLWRRAAATTTGG